MSWFEKYRPKTPEQLAGEDQRRVAESLLGGSTIQRTLFIGGSGTGKTTIARMYAAHLNESGRYRYVNCADVGVADLRDILEKSRMVRPTLTGDKYIVLILDELDGLSKTAQQSLLNIEDLPEWVILLGATKDPQKLRPDLKSRFTVFTLRTPDRREINQYLLRILEAEAIDWKPLKGKISALIDGCGGNLRTLTNDLEKLAQGVGTTIEEFGEANNVYVKLRNALLGGGQVVPKQVFGLLEDQTNYTGLIISLCREAMQRNNMEFLAIFGGGLPQGVPDDVGFAHLVSKLWQLKEV